MENLTTKASILNDSIFNIIDSGKELEFKKLILSFIDESEDMTLTELVDLILDKTGIRSELEKEDTIESNSRLENLEEFKSVTKSFEDKFGVISLSEFLDEISLVSDLEEYKNRKDVVTLMTVHSAKGLEFDNVFIIGLEENIFPHTLSLNSNDDLEEERRLFYVATTRARKNLYLLNSKKRLLFGQDGYNEVSRFIFEIDKDFLQLEKEKNKVSALDNKIKIANNNVDSNCSYELGEKVSHQEFGIGVIVGIDKSVLTIAFEYPVGIKKMIKGHKSIKKIS